MHALQIEVSRALYLDESRMERSGGFLSCRDRLRVFAAKLLSEASGWLKPARRAVHL